MNGLVLELPAAEYMAPFYILRQTKQLATLLDIMNAPRQSLPVVTAHNRPTLLNIT